MDIPETNVRSSISGAARVKTFTASRNHMAKNNISPFSTSQLESIAKVLGDTDRGLTGSEIGRRLAESKMPDVDSENTKWKRLYNALADMQNKKKFGNHVILFINAAMAPSHYTTGPGLFDERRDRLNPILSFSGMHIGEDGKVRRAQTAKTLTEAMQRASRLRTVLVRRGVHDDVLGCCKAELVAENYFHAVFEAMKSIATKIREKSGLDGDGAQLVRDAFQAPRDGMPLLAINSYETESQRGEQRGFVSLLIGLFGAIRNPLAHTPKDEWPINEQDAMDILTTLSLVHRKLDKSYMTVAPV